MRQRKGQNCHSSPQETVFLVVSLEEMKPEATEYLCVLRIVNQVLSCDSSLCVSWLCKRRKHCLKQGSLRCHLQMRITMKKKKKNVEVKEKMTIRRRFSSQNQRRKIERRQTTRICCFRTKLQLENEERDTLSKSKKWWDLSSKHMKVVILGRNFFFLQGILLWLECPAAKIADALHSLLQDVLWVKTVETPDYCQGLTFGAESAWRAGKWLFSNAFNSKSLGSYLAVFLWKEETTE